MLTEALLGLEVEHQPVQPVLEQGPDRVARRQQADRAEQADPGQRPDRQRDDRRPEDQDRHHRVHAREGVEQAGLEHRRRGTQDVGPALLSLALCPAHGPDLITTPADA
jgi:hypothetical protein